MASSSKSELWSFEVLESAAIDSAVTLPFVAQWDFAVRIHLFAKRNNNYYYIDNLCYSHRATLCMFLRECIIQPLWYTICDISLMFQHHGAILSKSLEERYTSQHQHASLGSAPPLRNDWNFKMLNYSIIVLSIKTCNILLQLTVLSCFDMCGGWIQTSVLVPYDLRCTAWCHTLRRLYLDEILSDHMELSLMFLYILHIHENN
jgi:hypothetical protein